jgi:protein-tyrosine-phosphatase
LLLDRLSASLTNTAPDMKILFVCEGNINRSQMAGTIFRSLVPNASVMTAGVYADHAGEILSAIPGGSIEDMKEIGYDMSQNRITQLTPAVVADADKIILVGPVPRGPLPEYLTSSSKLETWDVPDPGYGHISPGGARDMILERVRVFAATLATQ